MHGSACNITRLSGNVHRDEDPPLLRDKIEIFNDISGAGLVNLFVPPRS